MTSRLPLKQFTLLSLLCIGTFGCSSTSYRGLEPFARTFHEDANARDYYVGMNLNFTVDQDSPHLPPAHRLDPDVR